MKCKAVHKLTGYAKIGNKWDFTYTLQYGAPYLNFSISVLSAFLWLCNFCRTNKICNQSFNPVHIFTASCFM